jgi:hypothetical protein
MIVCTDIFLCRNVRTHQYKIPRLMAKACWPIGLNLVAELCYPKIRLMLLFGQVRREGQRNVIRVSSRNTRWDLVDGSESIHGLVSHCGDDRRPAKIILRVVRVRGGGFAIERRACKGQKTSGCNVVRSYHSWKTSSFPQWVGTVRHGDAAGFPFPQ